MTGPVEVLLDLIFPPKCVFCRKLLRKGEDGICTRCQEHLPWCVGPEAERTLEFVSLCASPLRYQDEVRESFHRYKFKGVRGYAKAYGRLMAQCVRDHLAGKYDLITWVPLSEQRRKARGYDQAMLLAEATALELGDVAAETLVKVRDTSAQSGLGKDDSARRADRRPQKRRFFPLYGGDFRVLFLKLRLKCVGTPYIIVLPFGIRRRAPPFCGQRAQAAGISIRVSTKGIKIWVSWLK